MKNIYELLGEYGFSVPEDQKTEFETAIIYNISMDSAFSVRFRFDMRSIKKQKVYHLIHLLCIL